MVDAEVKTAVSWARAAVKASREEGGKEKEDFFHGMVMRLSRHEGQVPGLNGDRGAIGGAGVEGGVGECRA